MPFRTGSPSGTTTARSCAKSLSRSFGSPRAGPLSTAASEGVLALLQPASDVAIASASASRKLPDSLIPAAIIRSLPMRFLGLDSSTQSLTALVVDTQTGEVIDRSVAFGARLPQYKSPSGFLPHADPRV